MNIMVNKQHIESIREKIEPERKTYWECKMISGYLHRVNEHPLDTKYQTYDGKWVNLTTYDIKL